MSIASCTPGSNRGAVCTWADVAGIVRRTEDALAAAVLLAAALLPVVELVLRTLFGRVIPGSSGYLVNLTLWLTLLGALIAAREGRHLDISAGVDLLSAGIRKSIDLFVAAISAGVSAALAWASFDFVRSEVESSMLIGAWLPSWVPAVILPVGFAAISARFVVGAGGPREQALAALGIPAAAAIGFLAAPYAADLLWPGIACLVAAAMLGTPIFVVIGGIALLLFLAEGVPAAAMPVETYRMVGSPAIPTIPLFTLAGYLLAEGGASRRLMRLFRALFGWLPGGLAIATVLVCAFFGSFSGASGVTILALGGLLLPVLLKSGYGERFSVGLLTATGSIGLLFPPSIAMILYGVIAHVPIPDMFMAGIVPGLLLVGVVCAFGVRAALQSEVPRPRFDAREAAAALWESKWDVLLPVVALYGIFGGFTTLIEAAAATAFYAFVIEVFIHRSLSLLRDLPAVLIKCAMLLGGVFVILGVAMGLSNYLVDAEVPAAAAAWVEARLDSRFMFLLSLNLFLLLVGCVMDIFSAMVVVVPLLIPIAAAFDVHPLHLGVIFLTNLELGYLTPPVGMNLFLAAYRFERPVAEICRSTLPFLLLLLGVVLLVTYVPDLIIGVERIGLRGTLGPAG